MRFVPALLAGLALSGVAAPALGTQCVETSIELLAESADVVFLGRALRNVDGRDSVMAVERVYKGEVPPEIVLRFHANKYAMLAPPGRYLVYGKLEESTERPGTIDVTSAPCSGSKLAAHAADDLAKLGSGSAPGKTLAPGKSLDAGLDGAPEPELDAGLDAPLAAEEADEPAAAKPLPRQPANAPPQRAGCAACTAGPSPQAPRGSQGAIGALLAALFVRRVTGRGTLA